MFRLLGLALLFGMLAVGGMWAMWGRNLPSVSDLDILEFSGQTRVYDRNNVLIGTLTPSLGSGQSVNRDLLKLEEISPYLQKAVVTSEDRRFFEHHGVDYIGIMRGLVKGVLKNDLEGGSSITQQVVKNTLLADLQGARTPERKFKEALLAYQLDRDFDKNQILSAYLNIIYWGDGGKHDVIGAQTAARAYFKKDARDLNLAESAYLATIIPAPNRRYKDFKAYRPLMKSLLDRMVEDGRVTRAEADAAWTTPIYPAGWRIGWNTDGTIRSAELERPERVQENMLAAEARVPNRYQYHYYLQAVEKELTPLIGRKALFAGGKIYTGMDVQAQQAAELASRNATLPDGATLGIALLNPANGEVLALVGQKLGGERPSDWNNALQAKRQVGSSIKPLLYTLALSRGWKQSDTVLDSPIQGEYQPMNYDRRWTGRYVTMRYALDHSLNLPTVRIGQELGIPSFEEKLRELGLTPPSEGGLSLTIGTLEASPVQMAAAYVPFANGGLYYAPSLVRKFEDKGGAVVYTRPAPVGKRVWDEQTAWLGLDMIRGVVDDLTPAQGGLATKAQIPGWPVGGKTGTTNDIKDLWFAGVTPLVAGAVWVGKQEGGSMPYWAYSGDIPTPVWQQAVAGALGGRSKATFKEPPDITYRVVRRVNMAFREAEADREPVARDGSRQTQATVDQTQPEPVAPPAPGLTPPENLPPQPMPTPQDIPATPPEPTLLELAPQPTEPEPTVPEPSSPEWVPVPAEPSEPLPTDPIPVDPSGIDPSQPVPLPSEPAGEDWAPLPELDPLPPLDSGAPVVPPSP